MVSLSKNREQVLNQIIKELYSRKMRYIAYKHVLQNITLKGEYYG